MASLPSRHHLLLTGSLGRYIQLHAIERLLACCRRHKPNGVGWKEQRRLDPDGVIRFAFHAVHHQELFRAATGHIPDMPPIRTEKRPAAEMLVPLALHAVHHRRELAAAPRIGHARDRLTAFASDVGEVSTVRAELDRTGAYPAVVLLCAFHPVHHNEPLGTSPRPKSKVVAVGAEAQAKQRDAIVAGCHLISDDKLSVAAKSHVGHMPAVGAEDRAADPDAV